MSYELHEQLAKGLQADIGHRPVQSLAVAVSANGTANRRTAKVPNWLDGKVSGGQVCCCHAARLIGQQLLVRVGFCHAFLAGTGHNLKNAHVHLENSMSVAMSRLGFCLVSKSRGAALLRLVSCNSHLLAMWPMQVLGATQNTA